jgi:hypothetical protein
MDLLKRRACMTGLILYNFFLKVQMIFFICMKFKIIIYFFFYFDHLSFNSIIFQEKKKQFVINLG